MHYNINNTRTKGFGSVILESSLSWKWSRFTTCFERQMIWKKISQNNVCSSSILLPWNGHNNVCSSSIPIQRIDHGTKSASPSVLPFTSYLQITIRITLQTHIMTSGFRTLTRLHSFAGHGQGPQWDDPELRCVVCLRNWNRNGVPSRVLPPHALAWLKCQERHPQKPYHLQLIVPS